MNLAFVTHYCTHYRVKTYELLAQNYAVDYYFYSAGNEWYWQKQHGTYKGNFRHKYLPGFQVSQTRVTPTLLPELWSGNYDVYMKCINGKFALPVTFLTARAKNKPFILWTGIWSRLQTPMHKLVFPLTRYIYQHSDAIVVYGEHVKQYLIDEGVAAERIFTTTHAVDNEFYSRTVIPEELSTLRDQLQIDEKQKVILYLGRLESGKGIEYLIRAFSKVDAPDTVLVLAGIGGEQQKLQTLVHELNLSHKVFFPGYVEIKKAVCYYALAWVYVLPSVTTENFKEPWGLVVNEAFNQGVPVIATDAVGAVAGGFVQDGINGYIVPERNSEALTDALMKLLTNPTLRDDMSKAAVKQVSRWTNEGMVEGFRQAIDYATLRKQIISLSSTKLYTK